MRNEKVNTVPISAFLFLSALLPRRLVAFCIGSQQFNITIDYPNR